MIIDKNQLGEKVKKKKFSKKKQDPEKDEEE